MHYFAGPASVHSRFLWQFVRPQQSTSTSNPPNKPTCWKYLRTLGTLGTFCVAPFGFARAPNFSHSFRRDRARIEHGRVVVLDDSGCKKPLISGECCKLVEKFESKRQKTAPISFQLQENFTCYIMCCLQFLSHMAKMFSNPSTPLLQHQLDPSRSVTAEKFIIWSRLPLHEWRPGNAVPFRE